MTSLVGKPETFRADEKISAYGPARSTIRGARLSPDELRQIDAFRRANSKLGAVCEAIAAETGESAAPATINRMPARRVVHGVLVAGACATALTIQLHRIL